MRFAILGCHAGHPKQSSFARIPIASLGVVLIRKADEPMNNCDSYISTMASEIMESPEQAQETSADQTDISVDYTWVRSKSDKKRIFPAFIRVPGFLARQARQLREFHD